MSVLSDKTLKEYLEEGKIEIEPLDYTDIQPASIDLRLGKDFLGFNNVLNIEYIDPKKDEIGWSMERVTLLEGKGIVIYPQEFILATTKEYVKVPDDLVARVEGRSSLGRLGLTMHVTAGYIDPGFEGRITLEIANLGSMPVALYPDMRVCQIVFETLTTPADAPYNHWSRDSKYMGQVEPARSRIEEDYELNGESV